MACFFAMLRILKTIMSDIYLKVSFMIGLINIVQGINAFMKPLVKLDKLLYRVGLSLIQKTMRYGKFTVLKTMVFA